MILFEKQILEDEIKILECYEYECNGYSQIITWLLASGEIDDQFIDRYNNEYFKCNAKKQILMNQLINKYVPSDYINANYTVQFDFNKAK